jgi:acyl-coenzyme A thioesterase PaaI-like protein
MADSGVTIVHELGFDSWDEGEEHHGVATVTPMMLAPETDVLRTSVLAMWADIVTGKLAVVALSPRVPVTLELGIDLYREPSGLDSVRAVGWVAKAGRSVVVSTTVLTDGHGAPVGVAHGSFMAAPGMVAEWDESQLESPTGASLSVPFAERAACTREATGVARIPLPPGGGNAVGTLNGGLLALVAEEAALSARSARGLSHLALRYLRPVRTGPAIARAEVLGEVANIEIRDEGDGGKLAVLATAHLWS